MKAARAPVGCIFNHSSDKLSDWTISGVKIAVGYAKTGVTIVGLTINVANIMRRILASVPAERDVGKLSGTQKFMSRLDEENSDGGRFCILAVGAGFVNANLNRASLEPFAKGEADDHVACGRQMLVGLRSAFTSLDCVKNRTEHFLGFFRLILAGVVPIVLLPNLFRRQQRAIVFN